jgi:hypothetical protein
MSYTYEQIRAIADVVRNIDLVDVLKRSGAVHDRLDKAKWLTSQGLISVTGQKFMNWTQGDGGGGAIDLAMLLHRIDYKSAVIWLNENVASNPILPCAYPNQQPPPHKTRLMLPDRYDLKWPSVRNYLENQRGIPKDLIDFLADSNRLYADKMGNAVFLLLGKEKKIVGAELRGTGNLKWRGMVKGSRKDLGCFSIKREHSKVVIICESAIDAVSYFAMNRDCIAVSTSGVNSNPVWLPRAIKKGYLFHCAFDSDETGDLHASQMIKRYPSVKRLRPLTHDWNDMLLSITPLS